MKGWILVNIFLLIQIKVNPFTPIFLQIQVKHTHFGWKTGFLTVCKELKTIIFRLKKCFTTLLQEISDNYNQCYFIKEIPCMINRMNIMEDYYSITVLQSPRTMSTCRTRSMQTTQCIHCIVWMLLGYKVPAGPHGPHGVCTVIVI